MRSEAEYRMDLVLERLRKLEEYLATCYAEESVKAGIAYYLVWLRKSIEELDEYV